jgi:hypothetical protein
VCLPLPLMTWRTQGVSGRWSAGSGVYPSSVALRGVGTVASTAASGAAGAEGQGLTLVHFSAQLERFLSFYGVGGARRGCVARVPGLLGGV